MATAELIACAVWIQTTPDRRSTAVVGGGLLSGRVLSAVYRGILSVGALSSAGAGNVQAPTGALMA